MSAVEELLLAVRAREESHGNSEGRHSSPAALSRMPKVNRRCLVRVSIVALCLVGIFAGSWLSLSSFFQRHLSRADIVLENAIIEFGSDAKSSHRLQFALSLPQSALALPVASYTLHIRDIKVEMGRGISDADALGMLTLPDILDIHSWRDLNEQADGDLVIVDDAGASVAFQEFLRLQEVPMWSKITCRLQAKIWNWLPFEISLALKSQSTVVGLHFTGRQITVGNVLKAEGQPHSLALNCEASYFNPTKVHIVVREHLQTRVHYNSTDVGSLDLAGLRLSPGHNTLNGNFTMNHSAANEEAIARLVESYVGSERSGTQLSVNLVGPLTSQSNLLSNLLDKVPIPVKFKPSSVHFLHKLTADIVIGGRITHWPSASYHATLNFYLYNPLPTSTRIDSIFLEAFNGSSPIFHFKQDLDANVHVIPALSNTTLRLPLYVSQVSAPENIEELNALADSSAERLQRLRINAQFLVIISPAHRQKVNFKQGNVPGIMCYHREESEHVCGEMKSNEVVGLV